MSKHTPLPWDISRHSDPNCAVRYVVTEENGYEVCSFFNSLEENVANSEFIMRACNNHYEMLEALKALTADCCTLGDSISEEEGKALDAIAKAEKEE